MSEFKTSPEVIDAVHNALRELPPIWQAVGSLNERIFRCKHGSPRYLSLCKVRLEFQRQAEEISSGVRILIQPP